MKVEIHEVKYKSHSSPFLDIDPQGDMVSPLIHLHFPHKIVIYVYLPFINKWDIIVIVVWFFSCNNFTKRYFNTYSFIPFF